ncbi:MAG: FAD-binding oxidoreductase [bacterium]|nr:FAD-binding oxidoreductase [bacterium]
MTDFLLEQHSLKEGTNRIIPDPWLLESEAEESLSVWGFQDTRFELNDKGEVRLTGNRYPLCGAVLPSLWPWIQKVMQISLDPKDLWPVASDSFVPDSVLNEPFLEEVRSFLQTEQISQSSEIRLRHGHGHTQSEMYAIKYGRLKRVPDLVVFPKEESEILNLVNAARRHNVCLIPYGGGTSVTEALKCPEHETRMIVSIDMKRMSRILWIDPVNRMACIQAGAVGRHIMAQLQQYGFTMGHDPDSVEFSTLGGWIATHASGMKKNKYGNIEDLVLDLHAVTPAGTLERSSLAPRESAGIDPRLMLFGSEGSLGLITRAVVKIFPLPEVQKYGSIIFPSFEKGVQFMYDLTQNGSVPASLRLVDNLQFQFSLALKSRSVGLKKIKSLLEKFWITRIKRFDPGKMVACTLVFEGGRDEVRRQEQVVYRLARKSQGIKAGAQNGERGYQLTFSIAYIRDFVMKHYILAESFETSVSWSEALALCANVKRRVETECEKHKLPGRPFVTCRVTQVYETGVCIYFYFGFYCRGVSNPSEVYSRIEAAARDEILRSGGSLSHHHGVGKLRERFLDRIKSPALLMMSRETKRALDPGNLFGCNNQQILSPSQEKGFHE